MNNKIETLRALWFMVDESPEIVGFDFTEDEKKLVEEFKKIYELGLPQLKKFIDLLDKFEDTYTILYFKSVLRNGPFKEQVELLIESSKKLKDVNDNIGNIGIAVSTPQNTVIFEGTEMPELPKTITSKLPTFMSDVLKDSITVTENLFRKGLTSSSSIDDTRPIMDKQNQTRYDTEPSGEWTNEANANFMVKDRYFYTQIKSISEDINKKVKKYLDGDNPQPGRYQILTDIKDYNPFTESNESISATPKKNKITEKVDGEEMVLDLMGDTIITKTQLSKTISIIDTKSNKSINLNTNKGQLDS